MADERANARPGPLGFMRAAAAAAQFAACGMLDALLPRGCAGCDRPDAVLCSECQGLFSCILRRELRGSVMGCSYDCGAYQGVVRQAILVWKDHGDEQCTEPFARMLAELTVFALGGTLAYGRKILIVPAPSSVRSVRRRGRWHMLQLARQLARLLRGNGINAQAAPVLTMHAVAGKSVEMLGSSQRASRIGGHVTVRRSRDINGALAIVIDDIITTGSTMRQCVGALRAGGATVLTALALAQAGDA